MAGNMLGGWEFIIYREMILKKSSQEPLGQFQPNLIGNMLGGWGFRFVQIKWLAPFGAQSRAK